MKRVLRILFCCYFLFGTVQLEAQERIKMTRNSGGTFTIPCEVNGINLFFILDTGASNVSLSLVEALMMIDNSYLSDSDILGSVQTQMADGSIADKTLVNLNYIQIGSKILYDVRATISSSLEAPLLLGQSVLSQLGSYTIYGDHLILNDNKDSFGNKGAGTYDTISELKNKAYGGNIKAILDLEFIYSCGLDVEEDYSEAIYWYRKAAEQGDADGQYYLGDSYENGTGITKNKTEAIKWYKKVAKKGLDRC